MSPNATQRVLSLTSLSKSSKTTGSAAFPHTQSKTSESVTTATRSDNRCIILNLQRSALLALNPLGRFTYTQEVFLNLAFKQLRIVEGVADVYDGPVTIG